MNVGSSVVTNGPRCVGAVGSGGGCACVWGEGIVGKFLPSQFCCELKTA